MLSCIIWHKDTHISEQPVASIYSKAEGKRLLWNGGIFSIRLHHFISKKRIFSYCGMSAESQNSLISRQPLQGNSSVITFPCLPGHVTTAVLTCNRGTHHVRVCSDLKQQQESCGKQCCQAIWCQVDNDTAMEHVIRHPHQQRNDVLCGSVRRLHLKNWNKPVNLEKSVASLESLQTDRPVWVCACCETVAPGGGMGGGGAPTVVGCYVTVLS
jgi:hypothetical protein